MPKARSRGDHSPKGRTVFATLVGLLVAGLVVAVLLSLATGAIRVSPGAILGALFRHHPLTATQEIIVLQIRLPRVLASAIVAAANRPAPIRQLQQHSRSNRQFGPRQHANRV